MHLGVEFFGLTMTTAAATEGEKFFRVIRFKGEEVARGDKEGE